MNEKIIVKKVNIMGWGGGPGMTYGIVYTGQFKVELSIGGMLKFTALTKGTQSCCDNKDIPAGFVFYSAPNTIREMF